MHQIHSLNQKHLINLNEYNKPHENDCSTKQELLLLNCLSSFVLTFTCQLKTTPTYNSCEKTQNDKWGHFEKQNFTNIPVNMLEKISIQDVVEAAVKDIVLSEHLQKNQSSHLGSNRRQLYKLGSNSKMKNKHHIEWHKFYKVCPGKGGYNKSFNKDRGMNQTNAPKAVWSICNASKFSCPPLHTY